MYTSACGDSVDYSEFIWGIHTEIVVWYLNMALFAYVAFQGIFVVGTYVAVAW